VCVREKERVETDTERGEEREGERVRGERGRERERERGIFKITETHHFLAAFELFETFDVDFELLAEELQLKDLGFTKIGHSACVNHQGDLKQI